MSILDSPDSILGPVEQQRAIELAMLQEDHASMKRLIGASVGEVLTAGLTAGELATFEAIRQEHEALVRGLISEAFGRGWVKGGEPRLSNAMHEVLMAAQHAVRGFKNPH